MDNVVLPSEILSLDEEFSKQFDFSNIEAFAEFDKAYFMGKIKFNSPEEMKEEFLKFVSIKK